MYDVTCLDEHGNVITHLTQWDMGQKIRIRNLDLTTAPDFHFCNINSKTALVVSSILIDDSITVDIPNKLLQEGLAIIAYIYPNEYAVDEDSGNPISKGKTITTIKIPVRPRPKPDDYEYVENVDYITATAIEEHLRIYLEQNFQELETTIKGVIREDISDLSSELHEEQDEAIEKFLSYSADASPKGTFENVTELSGKDAGIYLNADDKYLYFWDGETLSDGIYVYAAGGGTVSSVNGKVGDVVLTVEEIGGFNREETMSQIRMVTSEFVTEEDVNSKLSSVYKYKGTVEGYPLLPTNANVGDVYNIKRASGERYNEEAVTYPDWEVYDNTIPPFAEHDLNGFCITMPVGDKPSFMDGDKLKIGIYSFSHGDIAFFEVPILNQSPDPATSGAYYDDIGGYLYIFVVYSEVPFDSSGEMFYNFLVDHPWNPDEKPHLHFNDEMKYVFEEPYIVNAGDNVAWTGTEWDVLGGTVDVSMFAENDLSNVDNETFKAKAEVAGVAGGAVLSVNGKVGEVELSLSDINSFLTADNNEFEYKQSDGTYFSVDYGGMVAKGEGGSGYSLSVTPSGLSISGNPYCNNDITLVQNNWVDENDQSQGIVTTTHKLSEKADKTSILITSESSLILTHNQEARLGEIATLTLSMPSTTDDLYWSSFCFASGATATSISYSGEPIIWRGDDCDAEGNFVPEANTKYEVHIKKLGSDIVARVGAY